MWLYFNNNGQLLEVLMHGPQPRAGTTDFEIVAYFEGKDIFEDYTNANIRLVRPELEETEQFVPEMVAIQSRTFEALENESPVKFEDGKQYDVYKFDFTEDMTDEDGIVTMILNMSGLWKANITLTSVKGRDSVQGEVTFLVEKGSVESEDPVTIPNSVMFKHIASELARKSSFEYVNHVLENEKSRSITAENNLKTQMWNAIDNLTKAFASSIEGKISQKEGYDLISVQEIERLSRVSNYDDSDIKRSISDAKKAFHYVKVSHNASKGNWDYQFMFVSSVKEPFLKLMGVATHLKETSPSIVIPATGTYYDTEARKNYMVASIKPSPTEGMAVVAMVEAATGTTREIETGMIDIIDTVVI